jgi:hypothetical protein
MKSEVSDSMILYALLRHVAMLLFCWPMWKTVTNDSITPRNQGRGSCKYINTLRCNARISYCSSFLLDNVTVVRVQLSASKLKLLVQSLCTA